MTTILSNRRSKFGMTCVQCDNELIALRMSGKLVIFGIVRNVTSASSWSSLFLPSTSPRKISRRETLFSRRCSHRCLSHEGS